MTPTRRYTLHRMTVRVVREPGLVNPRVFASSKNVVAALQAIDALPDDGQEHFGIFCVDAQNREIGWWTVGTGTLSASLVSPREIFRTALLTPGCASIILAHNHPSGVPTPSKDDLRLTAEIVKAGALVDIRVLDHVILGTGTSKYVSLADEGEMTPSPIPQ